MRNYVVVAKSKPDYNCNSFVYCESAFLIFDTHTQYIGI